MAKRFVRPIRVEGNIAYVPLTQGYEALIDAADVPLVDGYNWSASVKPGKPTYAYRNKTTAPHRYKPVKLHRELTMAPEGVIVDHINGNGLDNRRCNLRFVDASQNAFNSAHRSDNTSGARGVSWRASRGKWRARIGLYGREHHLGLFCTKDEAIAAYNAAAERLHGEYRRNA